MTIIIRYSLVPAKIKYLKGKIDDLRFYKRILSEAEILNLYLENR